MTATPKQPFLTPKGIAYLCSAFILGGLTVFGFGHVEHLFMVDHPYHVMAPHIPTPPAPPVPPVPPASPETFVVVEQMPALIGGLQSIQQELRYPAIARKAGIEGRVIVQFVVNKQGRVEETRVVKGLGGGCDEEAVRAVRQARFRPGKQRGQAVRVKMSIPITFHLPAEGDALGVAHGS